MAKGAAGVSTRWITGLIGLAAGFLALGLFSQTLFNTAHNEQMYVAAAYLLTQGQRLYTDFAFVQMPYSPLIYAAVYSLTGSGFYLLKAKLVNYLFMLLAAGLLYGRVWRVTQDRALALLLVVILFANYYLLRATIEASNYTLPVAFGLLAALCLLAALDGGRRAALWCLAAGVALAVAIGAKLYYATLLAPFVLAALLYPRAATGRARLVQGVLPLVAGVWIGLLPVFYYAARDWDRFRFNNLGYHLLNTLWRAQNGFTDMGWSAKLETARDLATNPNFAPLGLWLALAGLLWWNRRAAPVAWPSPGAALAGMAAVVSLLTAFTPRPLFPQYFAMPIPFMLLWVGELVAGRTVEERRLLRQLGMVVALIALLAVLPRHTGSLRRWAAGADRWSGIESVQASRALAAQLAGRGLLDRGAPLVATLSPVAALEAHLPFYPELATGSFVYRIGDLLTPEERLRYVATSPSTLAELFDAQPPAAILIGEEDELETPLLDYAQSRGYTPVELGEIEGQFQLYVQN